MPVVAQLVKTSAVYNPIGWRIASDPVSEMGRFGALYAANCLAPDCLPTMQSEVENILSERALRIKYFGECPAMLLASFRPTSGNCAQFLRRAFNLSFVGNPQIPLELLTSRIPTSGPA